MNINLYPYNWYLFFGALVVLVIFGIVTVVRVLPLIKAVKSHSEEINNIKINIQFTKIKTSVLKESKESSKKSDQALNSLLLLWAIHKAYKANDKHGPRAYVDTAAEVLQKRKAKADLFRNLRSDI